LNELIVGKVTNGRGEGVKPLKNLGTLFLRKVLILSKGLTEIKEPWLGKKKERGGDLARGCSKGGRKVYKHEVSRRRPKK